MHLHVVLTRGDKIDKSLRLACGNDCAAGSGLFVGVRRDHRPRLDKIVDREGGFFRHLQMLTRIPVERLTISSSSLLPWQTVKTYACSISQRPQKNEMEGMTQELQTSDSEVNEKIGRRQAESALSPSEFGPLCGRPVATS